MRACLVGLLVCLATALETPAVAAGTPVLISGVLFNGRLKGDPEPEEAVRLTSTNLDAAVELGDFKLTDRYGPRRYRNARFSDKVDEKISGQANEVALPSGATIPPGGDIWIAHTAKGFAQIFGFKPDFEAVDTDPDVPNALVVKGWLELFSQHGIVSLHDRTGEVVDVVAYDTKREPKLDLSTLPPKSWLGPPVRLAGAALFGWSGQILARDRDEGGRLLPDSNRAGDWDGGFSVKQLGIEPTHRLELPGQTRFIYHPLQNIDARVVCTSAPENNFAGLARAFGQAQKSIRVSVYKFTNDLLADHLVKALGRGVEVTIWTEGSPVGGLEDQSRYILDRLHRAGAKVFFLVRDKKDGVFARYRFDHSKYAIIDDRVAIIGTENYGRTGHPADPSFGNRGYEVHIEHPGFVQQLLDVWNADMAVGRAADVRSIDARSDDTFGKPFKNARFKVDRTLIRGLYPRRTQPLLVNGRMDLALVLSPDNSLNENNSLLGMIKNAKRELLVQQNSIPLRWGRRGDTMDKTPNLALAAVVAAARRGVRTRVLLDGTWYNIEASDDRDNDDTVAYLNDLARTEKLDLQAKVVNLVTTHLEKIHAKGVIVDKQKVFVGSINWSENSFKGNREVGVIIRHKKVAGYYRDLFNGDWRASRLFRIEVSRQVSVTGHPKGGKRLGRLAKGDRVNVISEVGSSRGRPTHYEVVVSGSKTGFVPTSVASKPILIPQETAVFVGRPVRIEGRVLRTDVGDKVVRLHFTHGHGFVAVLFVHHSDRFKRLGVDPAKDFTGKRVAIQGVLRYYGAPEIILKKPEQIEILAEE